MRESKPEVAIKEEIAGVFDVVAERLPKLIASLKDCLFSEEAGREIGRAVGAFYKEILASGIDAEMASDLTKAYMSTLQNAVKPEPSGGGSTIRITRDRDRGTGEDGRSEED
jgi:hypothetical protein